MKNFDELREEAKRFVKENKNFFDRFSQDINNLTIGNYIDLYIGSKGISALNTGLDFNNDYDKTLNEFYSDRKRLDAMEELIIGFLDFLIWLRKQQDIYKIEIKERKRLHKNALEYPPTINRIYLNKEIQEKDKIEIFLFYYCSLQEIFKNVIQEELLLEIGKQGKNIRNLGKSHISLGHFKSIIETYENQCNSEIKISTIFNIELRNKVFHADYSVGLDGVKYGTKSISKTELYDKIIQLGVSLQFFVLFYLKLFNETTI